MKLFLFILALAIFGAVFAEEVIQLPSVTTYIYNSDPVVETQSYTQALENTTEPNLSEFLKSQGLLVMQTGGKGALSEVSIGGYTNFCVKVYVNGVLANDPRTGAFDWNQIPLDEIATIETAQHPSIEGAEFAGTCIYITTKKWERQRSTIRFETESYEASLFDSRRLTFTSCGAIKDWLPYHFVLDGLIAENRFYTLDQYVNTNNKSQQLKLAFDTGFYLGNVFFVGRETLGANNTKDPNSSDDLSLQLEKDICSRTDISISDKSAAQPYKVDVWLNVSSMDYQETSRLRTKFTDIGEGFTSQVTLWKYLELGLDFSHEQLEEYHRLMLAPKLGFKYVNELLKLELLCKGSFDLSRNQYLLVPSFYFSIKPGFTVSFFRQNVNPTFNQLYYKGSCGKGNPDLVPEDGWGGSIEFRRKNFPVYASYSLTWYKDKICWRNDPSDNILTSMNVSSAWFHYAKLGSSYQLGDFFYDVNVSYTKTLLEQTSKQIMWVPEWQWHIGLSYQFSELKFNTNLNYCSKRPIDNNNSAYLDAYLLWDLSIVWQMNRCEITVAGKNLLDCRYQYHPGYYAPSRSILVGLKYTL